MVPSPPLTPSPTYLQVVKGVCVHSQWTFLLTASHQEFNGWSKVKGRLLNRGCQGIFGRFLTRNHTVFEEWPDGSALPLDKWFKLGNSTPKELLMWRYEPESHLTRDRISITARTKIHLHSLFIVNTSNSYQKDNTTSETITENLHHIYWKWKPETNCGYNAYVTSTDEDLCDSEIATNPVRIIV